MPPKNLAAGLTDVARRAGVSIMTVSRVMRSAPGVSEATRKRVLKAADALGYRPNPILSELMSDIGLRRNSGYRGNLVWLNVHPIRDYWTSPFIRDIRLGAQARAEKLGFKLEEFWLHEKGVSPRRLGGIWTTRGVSGVVLSSDKIDPAAIDLPWDKFAWACLGMPSGDRTAVFHGVGSDHAENIRLIYSELTRRGYSRPGLVLNHQQDDETHHLVSAIALLHEHHKPARRRVPPLLLTNYTEAEFPRFEAWLRDSRPDVVISCTSHLVDWLRRAGREVPADCGAVHLSVQSDVAGWAGTHSPQAQIGAETINLLTTQIFHQETGFPELPRKISVKSAWTEGWTLRPRAAAPVG
jgi:LacI family transcriptional regulator